MSRPSAFFFFLGTWCVLALTTSPSHGATQVERVSVSSDGQQANAESWVCAISLDGHDVAFQSHASNLVANDTNGCCDIFVRDRQTGQTLRASVASDGAQANGPSYWPSISADGRYVAFESNATNLVAGDTNGVSDIFLHDRETGETIRVSVAGDGAQADGASYWPSISANGWYVAFASSATNLVPGDTNGWKDIFVYDREASATTRVSVATDGSEALGTSDEPSLSSDGRYVAFTSRAVNLVPNDTNYRSDVFVHDRQRGTTTRVSVGTPPPPPPGGISVPPQGNGDSSRSFISADGQYVVFLSLASNLVVGDTNALSDVFVHDRETGETTRVSVSTAGTQGNGAVHRWPGLGISFEGRFVVFASEASNLVPNDTNKAADIFIRDRFAGETKRVNLSTNGYQAVAWSEWATISLEGDFVAYLSYASNLVPGDTNQAEDIFVTANPCMYNRPPRCGIARPPDCVQVGQIVGFTSLAVDPDGRVGEVLWDFGDGATGLGMSVSHVYSAEGRYHVSTTVTDDQGAKSACAVSLVVGNPPPLCSIGYSPWSVQAHQSVTFTAVASATCVGHIDSYLWNFGDGSRAYDKSVSHAFSAAGQYAVSCTVTDDRRVSSACMVTVTVTADPVPPIPGSDAFWFVRLKLYNGTLYGIPRDTSTMLGVRPGATDGYEALRDAHKPPTPPPFIYSPFLYIYWYRPWGGFPDPPSDPGLSNRFTSDFRAVLADDQTKIWEDLRVQSSIQNTTLVLAWDLGSFDGSYCPPTDYSFTLYDEGMSPNPGGGTALSMGLGCSYVFPYAGPSGVEFLGEPRYFHIVVTHSAQQAAPRCSALAWPVQAVVRETVSFDSLATAAEGHAIATVSWDFGDSTTGTGISVSHSYSEPGLYVVACTVTDNVGLTSSCTSSITIKQPEAVALPDHGWQMIAAPNAGDHPLSTLKVTSNNGQVLDFCGAVVTGWVDSLLYWYDTAHGTYRTASCNPGEEDDTLRAGRSYWIRTGVRGLTLTFPSATDTLDNTVPLPNAGWYMIAQPHYGDHPLSVCSVQRLDTGVTIPFCFAWLQDLIQAPLFTYAQHLHAYSTCGCEASPVDDDNTLRQGRGYWLKTFQDGLVLIVP